MRRNAAGDAFEEDVASVETLAPPGEAGAYASRAGLPGLHSGSGVQFFDNCLNTDFLTLIDPSGATTEPGGMYLIDGSYAYLHHDATKRFPLETDTFHWAYSEHFIEHLEPEMGVRWLRQMRRLTKPGGVIRVSTPDLRKYIAGYVDPDNSFFRVHHEHIRELRGVKRRGSPNRPAWMVNQIFFMWGHRWIYDFDELRHAGVEAGYAADSCVERSFGEGQLAEAAALDVDWRAHESVYVEYVNDRSG
jgi:predicted SAM-dependent methyltransferase